MPLYGLPLTSQGLHGPRLCAALVEVQARFQARFLEYLTRHAKRAASVLGAPPKALAAGQAFQANIATAGQLGRSFELLERVLGLGAQALETCFSANADSQENIAARVPQELEHGPEIDLRFVLLGPIRALNPLIRVEVYRIGSEALRNAIRHSSATAIEVELEYAPLRFRLVVRDNGRGIDQRQLRPWRDGHRGLSGMATLAGTIGATLTLWSRRSCGTELELSIPNQIAL